MPEVPTELLLEGVKALVKLDLDWIPTAPNTSLYLRPTLIGTEGFLGVRRTAVIQSGFSQTTNMVPTIDNINFVATLSNPYPNGITAPVGAAGSAVVKSSEKSPVSASA